METTKDQLFAVNVGDYDTVNGCTVIRKSEKKFIVVDGDRRVTDHEHPVSVVTVTESDCLVVRSAGYTYNFLGGRAWLTSEGGKECVSFPSKGYAMAAMRILLG